MQATRLFPRSIDSLGDLFAFVGEQLPENVAERIVLHVDLAVEEIFTNMVRHNQPGGDEISVAVELADGAIRVRFVDRDVEPFDPESVPAVEVDRPMSERRAGGLGLHLIKSVVDRLVYEYQERVMQVSFVKSLETADARDQA